MCQSTKDDHEWKQSILIAFILFGLLKRLLFTLFESNCKNSSLYVRNGYCNYSIKSINYDYNLLINTV